MKKKKIMIQMIHQRKHQKKIRRQSTIAGTIKDSAKIVGDTATLGKTRSQDTPTSKDKKTTDSPKKSPRISAANVEAEYFLKGSPRGRTRSQTKEIEEISGKGTKRKATSPAPTKKSPAKAKVSPAKKKKVTEKEETSDSEKSEQEEKKTTRGGGGKKLKRQTTMNASAAEAARFLGKKGGVAKGKTRSQTKKVEEEEAATKKKGGRGRGRGRRSKK